MSDATAPKLGFTQRRVLFELAGSAETLSSLAVCVPFASRDAIRAALQRLWQRKLVERTTRHGEFSWDLTPQGRAAVGEIFESDDANSNIPFDRVLR